MGDLIILIPVLVLTGYIIARGVKNVKKGECSCSQGCSTCSETDSCNDIRDNK
jgi:hypothetical protein